MDATKVEIPPSGEQLLELYKHQFEMADKSLAVERDIVVKNFGALGAIILAQAGFVLSSLKLYLVLTACGVVLILISIAARVMAIIYGKYSKLLFILAGITLTVYLRGRDGSNIRDRAKLASEEKKLPDADDISWEEVRGYGGALALINLIPAGVGLLMIIAALIIFGADPDPWWKLTNPPMAK